MHGNIHISQLERELIDSEPLQRLRNIRQNDLAHLVYPSMSTSRFEHSIGVMHLAGRFLSSALANTDSSLVHKFLAAVHAEAQVRPQSHAAPGDDVLQAVRLAGLLHDIGHLPFSHLFESVLDGREELVLGREIADFRNSGTRLHEFSGERLFQTHPALGQFLRSRSPQLYGLTRALLVRSSNTPALHCLRAIIAAEIDADRADFILRDGRACGANFGQYDLDRLVDSMRLVYRQRGGTKQYVIAPEVGAVSTIEAFLLERYKLYKWVFFHHKVLSCRSCLRRALQIAIRLTPATRSRAVSDFDPRQFSYRNYAATTQWLDDLFVIVSLRGLYRSSRARPRRPRHKGEQRLHDELLALLDASLKRSPTVVSLWKRPDEFLAAEQYFRAKIHELECSYSQSIGNARTPEELEAHYGGVGHLYLNHAADQLLLTPADIQALEDELNSASSSYRYVVSTLRFRPGGLPAAGAPIANQILCVDHYGNLRPVQQFSRLVESLVGAWDRDAHLHVALVPSRRKTIDRPAATNRFCDLLAMWAHRNPASIWR